ncbi:MAG: hypothetical protein KGJ34_00370 [Patescibacteria group bacterium]|nr:hypothetical protein [Patescibacteria group bacterium]
MRSLLAALFSFAALVMFLAPAISQAASVSKSPALEVSAWIPYWSSATGTADALAHLNYLSEINPFGYIVQPDGTLYDPMGIDSPPWSTLIAAAKAKGVLVVPTVMWSDTTAINNILSNTTSRIALEKTIATLAFQQNFNGIDIDFEGKEAQDKNYFSLFLKGLYARMGNKWVVCTIEARTPVSDRYDGTPPADATEYANDFTAINKYCDRVSLMTYDQDTVDVKLNEAQQGLYMPIADPQWVSAVVNLAAQSISRRKIEIGVATYGYEYQVVPLQEGYQYNLQWAFDPDYATALAQSLGITPTRNSAGELSFTYTPTSMTDTTPDITPTTSLQNATTTYSNTSSTASTASSFNIVWWSDAGAIGDKLYLAETLGVRGVAIFKIDGREDPRLWSLLPKLH